MATERVLYYKYKIPPEQGNKPEPTLLVIDEAGERSRILTELGIDPALSDEELEGYKTQVVSSFQMYGDNPEAGYIEVLEWITSEIGLKKAGLDEAQLELDSNHLQVVNKWKEGYEVTKTLVTSPETESSLREQVEANEFFVSWIDYDLDETTFEAEEVMVRAELAEDRPAVEYDAHVVELNGQNYTVMFFMDSEQERQVVMNFEGYIKPASTEEMNFTTNTVVTVPQFTRLVEGSTIMEEFVNRLGLEDTVSDELDVDLEKTNRPMLEGFEGLQPSVSFQEVRDLEDKLNDKLLNILGDE